MNMLHSEYHSLVHAILWGKLASSRLLHLSSCHLSWVPLRSVIIRGDVPHLCFYVLDAQAERAILLDITQAGSADAQAQNPVDVHL